MRNLYLLLIILFVSCSKDYDAPIHEGTRIYNFPDPNEYTNHNDSDCPMDDSSEDESEDDSEEDKVYVCHVTPSGNRQTLYLPQSAVIAHLNHGDSVGQCD